MLTRTTFSVKVKLWEKIYFERKVLLLFFFLIRDETLYWVFSMPLIPLTLDEKINTGSEERPSSMQLFFKQTPAQLFLCGSHLVASPYVWHFWGQIAASSPSTSVKLRKFRCLTKAMLTPVSAPNLYHWATPSGKRGKPSVLRWRWRRLLSILSTAALFPRASLQVLRRASHQGEVM